MSNGTTPFASPSGLRPRSASSTWPGSSRSCSRSRRSRLPSCGRSCGCPRAWDRDRWRAGSRCATAQSKYAPCAGAAAPLVEPPGALGTGVLVALPLAGRILDVARAGRSGRRSRRPSSRAAPRATRTCARRGSRPPRVHWRRSPTRCAAPSRTRHRAAAGSSSWHRRQIVAPGVAVPLREEHARVLFVDAPVELAVPELVADRVVLHVRDLAVAAREVPEQPVVDRCAARAGQRVVAPAEQRELLVEQRVELVLECEERASRSRTRCVVVKPIVGSSASPNASLPRSV